METDQFRPGRCRMATQYVLLDCGFRCAAGIYVTAASLRNPTIAGIDTLVLPAIRLVLPSPSQILPRQASIRTESISVCGAGLSVARQRRIDDVSPVLLIASVRVQIPRAWWREDSRRRRVSAAIARAFGSDSAPTGARDRHSRAAA